MEKMKRIFVVDGCLKITQVKIPEHYWAHKIFGAKIGKQPIIVSKQGWNKLTTYGGFATEKGAENFKKFVQKVERKRRREEHKQRMVSPAV